MSLTLDRKVATGLLSKATTGDDLLNVLEMITSSFTKPPVNTVPMATKPSPTLEEIKF